MAQAAHGPALDHSSAGGADAERAGELRDGACAAAVESGTEDGRKSANRRQCRQAALELSDQGHEAIAIRPDFGTDRARLRMLPAPPPGPEEPPPGAAAKLLPLPDGAPVTPPIPAGEPTLPPRMGDTAEPDEPPPPVTRRTTPAGLEVALPPPPPPPTDTSGAAGADPDGPASAAATAAGAATDRDGRRVHRARGRLHVVLGALTVGVFLFDWWGVGEAPEPVRGESW